MFGSYNKFDARVHVDAHIVPVVDFLFLTSLLASIMVFSTLGHSAHVLGVPVKTVARLRRISRGQCDQKSMKGQNFQFLSGVVSTSCSAVLVHYIFLNAISS